MNTGCENISKSKALVSVIMPVKNAEAYLRESIESILSQSYETIELVIVDDGSSDGSLGIASEYADRLVLCSCESRGVWSARNFGVQVASGEYLAFQDADDVAFPDRIKIQMNYLLTNPEMGIVFGSMVEFQGESSGVVNRQVEELKEIKVRANCPGAMLLTRKAFKKVGEFTETWKIAGFIDWYMRALDLGIKVCDLSEVILARRVHQANSTLIEGSILPQEYLQAVRRGLQRRNSGGGNE